MALPSPDRQPSGASYDELSGAVATARDALLRFAAAEEGVLESLLCDGSDPNCPYPDLATVRRDVSVDELLHLVASIPDTAEEERGEEAAVLYPTLLELAELFDVFIEQSSLVHGDAIALAESMEGEWHAMSGCCNHAPSPADATVAVKRLGANLEALPSVLESLNRLSADAQRAAVARFERDERSVWRAEARYLAAHAVEEWLPQGIAHPQVLQAIQVARGRSSTRADGGQPAQLARATADLLLGRLVRGVARDSIADALHHPFAGIVPAR